MKKETIQISGFSVMTELVAKDSKPKIEIDFESINNQVNVWAESIKNISEKQRIKNNLKAEKLHADLGGDYFYFPEVI